MPQNYSLNKALRDAAGRLARAGVASPQPDARLIAAHLLGCGPMELVLHDPFAPGVPEAFGEAFAQHFEAMVARREQREPLQHILGTAPFGPLELEVGPGVFIPRPETEVLADWGVRTLAVTGSPTPRVVDLCTGSGALALYLAHYRPDAEVFAVELSPEAMDYARRNIVAWAPQIRLVAGDVTDPSVLSGINGTVDMVLTNPPYVPEDDSLDPEVYADPHMAVFSGETGMDLIEKLVPTLVRLLSPGGVVGIEHDDSTSEAVQRVLEESGAFADIAVLHDFTGTARFVTARRVATDGTTAGGSTTDGIAADPRPAD